MLITLIRDAFTMIDFDGTSSDLGLIPRRITLKDNEFDQWIKIIDAEQNFSEQGLKTKVDREALGKQIMADSIALNSTALIHKMSLNHDFEECLRNAEKGYIVSFFVEEVTLLSRKTALSENITLDFDNPYVLLNNGLRIPVDNAEDLERKVKGTWEEFFKLYGNSKGLEDFMADREQDVPKDRF